IMRCEPFGAHARERLSGKTRYYATDNGLLSAMSFNFQEEWGRLLENAVAVEAVRQGAALTYYHGKQECDFILLRDDRPWKAVQACWSLRDTETKKRELAGLVEACKALGLKKGLVLTADAAEDLKIEGIKVQVRPFREAETLLAR
ncbi:MAG: ATP-binding protein, partial [Bacteroidetes bacterium]|nr:ATP-binding protein [Bacteroidota bacterium]